MILHTLHWEPVSLCRCQGKECCAPSSVLRAAQKRSRKGTSWETTRASVSSKDYFVVCLVDEKFCIPQEFSLELECITQTCNSIESLSLSIDVLLLCAALISSRSCSVREDISLSYSVGSTSSPSHSNTPWMGSKLSRSECTPETRGTITGTAP